MRIVLVALAGAAGALSRYGIGSAVGQRSFPWGTLAINVVGSFALGLVLTLAAARGWSPDVTVPITIGFLGAFTTFSTFTWEGVDLLRSDRVAAAACYVGASVAVGLGAAALGLRVGEALRA